MSRSRTIVIMCLSIAVVVAGCGGDVDGPSDVEGEPRIVSLGDSWISGEGAKTFFADTNRDETNECRRSPTAYSYTLADDNDLGLVFIACSGAEIIDVIGGEGWEPSWIAPDDVIQIDRLPSDAAAVLISVGGNDAGFGAVVKSCLSPFGSCETNRDRWLADAADLAAELVPVYRAVTDAVGAEVPVFAMPYPNPLPDAPGCLSPLLNQRELNFLNNDFLPALNGSVQAAAADAGITFVDTTGAFADHLLCDDAPALNLIGISHESGTFDLRDFLHNTAHPNPLGHALIQLVVADSLAEAEIIQILPPTVDAIPDDLVPDEVLEDAMDQDPIDVDVPLDVSSADVEENPYAFPAGTACTGEAIDYAFFVNSEDDPLTISITDAAASSIVCFATAGAWDSVSADGEGKVEFDLRRIGGTEPTTDVVYQRNDGRWIRLMVAFP